MGGATAILDHLWVRNLDDVSAAVAAYRQLGIRVWLALMLADTEGDNYASACDDLAARVAQHALTARRLAHQLDYTACCPNAADRNAEAAARGCVCNGMGEGGVFRIKPNGCVHTHAGGVLTLPSPPHTLCPSRPRAATTLPRRRRA